MKIAVGCYKKGHFFQYPRYNCRNILIGLFFFAQIFRWVLWCTYRFLMWILLPTVLTSSAGLVCRNLFQASLRKNYMTSSPYSKFVHRLEVLCLVDGNTSKLSQSFWQCTKKRAGSMSQPTSQQTMNQTLEY